MPKQVIDPEKLVSQAYAIASRDGISALSVRKVATACGIAVGSVYGYFPTKADLTAAVLTRFFDENLSDELCAVLAGNIDFACNYIKTRFDGVEVTKPEGTYILFADCTKWCEAHGKTIDDVERACWDVGVALQDGRQFHGPCHIRMNLALPLSRVQEAFDRLDKYVFNT